MSDTPKSQINTDMLISFAQAIAEEAKSLVLSKPTPTNFVEIHFNEYVNKLKDEHKEAVNEDFENKMQRLREMTQKQEELTLQTQKLEAKIHNAKQEFENNILILKFFKLMNTELSHNSPKPRGYVKFDQPNEEIPFDYSNCTKQKATEKLWSLLQTKQ